MATAFLPQHTIENTDYAGQAYYGIDIDEPANPRIGNDLTNCVALVRDGLVIRYASEFAHEDRPPVVGVFEPDSDADSMQAFVFAEPAGP